MEPELVCGGLAFNPMARCAVEEENGRTIAISVTAPIRLRGLQRNRVSPDDEIFELMVRILSNEGDIETVLTDSQVARLQALGVLLAPAEIPREVRFSVPVDNWFPAGESANSWNGVGRENTGLRLADEDDDWTLNPHVRTAPGAQASDNLPTSVEPGPIVWVRHPVVGIDLPYWCGRLGEPIGRILSAGQHSAHILDATLSRVLRQTGILYRRSTVESGKKRWDEYCEAEAFVFQSARYCRVSNAFPDHFFKAIRTYYAELLSEGHVFVRGGNSPYDADIHNEPLGRFVLAALWPIVQRIASRPIKPSYCFFRRYQDGASLERHVDRSQCEYSVSMLLDYDPVPSGSSPWPLILENPTTGEQTCIFQRIGECLIYRGRQLPHYRERLPEAHASVHLFCHYVDAEFSGSLD